MARAEVGKEVEMKKPSVSEVDKVKRDSFNSVANLRERVAAASTGEEELLTDALEASYQMARTTSELLHARDIISTQSKDLSKVAQLKSSIKSIGDSFAFYDAIED